MKLPLGWLKEYVAFDAGSQELAELLTLSGTEVEMIETPGRQLPETIVVGEITKIEPHPQADRLLIARVRVKKQVLTIVCGAPNIKVGQKVPVALAGTRLPNGIFIKKAAIRGVESCGMLCAEDELGLGDDHAGILILSSQSKVGEPVRTVLGQDQVVFDLAITPNRADCYSIVGLAREVAALTGKKVTLPDCGVTEQGDESLPVRILEKKLCPLYSARLIKKVTIRPSPSWLKARLQASGIRPINNVVDVTNYCMLELGQPLHAFDHRGIQEIVVRTAKRGEKLKTLDGETRTLDNSMLLITDGNNPIALAGVMGGKRSEIKETTHEVILESAVFHPVSVRKTSIALGLRSESSMRFERGIDLTLTTRVLDRAAHLIAELSGGFVAGKKVVVGSVKVKERVIDLPPGFISKILGVGVEPSLIKKVLESLGFSVSGSKTLFQVTVPPWRQDVTIPYDLVEEVGRMLDYNQMKPTHLQGELQPPRANPEVAWRNRIKDILVMAGMTEVYNYSFYGEPWHREPHLKIENPLSLEQQWLRTSLEQGLLENAAKNLKNFETIKIFEVGKVYLPPLGKNHLPDEREMVAGVIGSTLATTDSYRLAKGIVELLGKKLGKPQLESEPSCVRRVDQKIISRFKLPVNVSYFILDFQALIKGASEQVVFEPLPVYPAMRRDLSFWINAGIKYRDIKKALEHLNPLLKQVELFDVFESKERKYEKSLAVHFVFQSEKRTLTADEVDQVMAKIIKRLEEKFKITLRK